MYPSTNTRYKPTASNETLAIFPPIRPTYPTSPYLKKSDLEKIHTDINKHHSDMKAMNDHISGMNDHISDMP